MSATPPRCVRALLGSVLALLAEEAAGSFEDNSLDAGGKKARLKCYIDLMEVKYTPVAL